MLGRHNSIIEELITATVGQVLKGTGDGHLALFAEPAARADCAARIQLAISAAQTAFSDGTQLLVRVACHGGPLRESGGDRPQVSHVAAHGTQY